MAIYGIMNMQDEREEQKMVRDFLLNNARAIVEEIGSAIDVYGNKYINQLVDGVVKEKITYMYFVRVVAEMASIDVGTLDIENAKYYGKEVE